MRNPRNDTLGSPKTEADASPAKGSERRCVLTGRSEPRDHLLRLALSPDGDVLPDAQAKAPGRGAWIGVTRAELAEARTNGKLKAALSRGFKTGAIAIPDDLEDRYETALRRAVCDRLGLELRAGHLILGSEKIAVAARSGEVAWLAHASDASEDGARKLDQAWRVGSDAEGSGMAGETLPLDRAALSVALGRENVVHLALTDRAAAARIAALFARLRGFLGGFANETTDGAASQDVAVNGF